MTSKTYTYRELPADPGSIRLLHVLPPQIDNLIRCELTVGNVNTSEYKALSYVWGPPHETFPIKVNGESWSVRKSLRGFLRKAQNDYANQPLWIDALCINQDDIPERNQQVSQMCQIYSQARLVLVWLENDISSFELFSHFSENGDWVGPVTEYENTPEQESMRQTFRDYPMNEHGWADPDELATGMIIPLDNDFESLEPWSERDKESARTVFTEVSQHPYWKRSWVVQEFCLAKDILFVFESMVIPFLVFERAFLLTDPDDADDTQDRAIKGISELVFWRQGVYQAVSEESKLKDPIDLHELLTKFGSRNCQDVRDRVFSLIGMCEEKGFQVDYNQTKQQLLVSVVRFLKSKGRNRFYTAMILVELLDLSLTAITSNMDSLPVLNLTYPLAVGLLVVNGTGAMTRSRQLWSCQCHQCHSLKQLLHSREQLVLVKTSLPSLWLLYLFKESKITEVNGSGEVEAYFRFVACAGPAAPNDYSHHAGQKLCAFIPEHPLLKLFHDSQISLKKDGRNTMKIHLNEHSIFADAFCASLSGSKSAPDLAHSSMVIPVEVGGYDHEQPGTVHYNWDWDRSDAYRSNGKSIVNANTQSVQKSDEDRI